MDFVFVLHSPSRPDYEGLTDEPSVLIAESCGSAALQILHPGGAYSRDGTDEFFPFIIL